MRVRLRNGVVKRIPPPMPTPTSPCPPYKLRAHVVLYLFTPRNSRIGATTACFPCSPSNTSAEVEACTLPACSKHVHSRRQKASKRRQEGMKGIIYRLIPQGSQLLAVGHSSGTAPFAASVWITVSALWAERVRLEPISESRGYCTSG